MYSTRNLGGLQSSLKPEATWYRWTSLENALTHRRSRCELTLRLSPRGATPTIARLRSVRWGHERRSPYPPHCRFDLEHLRHVGKWRSQEIFRSAARRQPHTTLLRSKDLCTSSRKPYHAPYICRDDVSSMVRD
jgi:hypothetical protein